VNYGNSLDVLAGERCADHVSQPAVTAGVVPRASSVRGTVATDTQTNVQKSSSVNLPASTAAAAAAAHAASIYTPRAVSNRKHSRRNIGIVHRRMPAGHRLSQRGTSTRPTARVRQRTCVLLFSLLARPTPRVLLMSYREDRPNAAKS